ncbi:MAG: peptidoglycan D,D-transpeptidase FtsI family protein, partial [Neisseriaceae bacterium]
MLANSDIQRLYSQSGERTSHSIRGSQTIVGVPAMATKTKAIALIAFLMTVAIICRIVYLNTFNNNFLNKQLDSRIMRTVKIPSMRGTIMDRNNNALAVSTPVSSIWVDPTQLDDLSKSQVEAAAKILGMSVASLNSKLNQKNKTFVYVKRAVTPAQAAQVLALGIDGIYSMQEYKRFYPYANVTAHIVGFNNIDDNGAEGIEYADNKELVGHEGQEKILRDRRGHVVEKLGEVKAAEDGKNVVLAIDNKIQFIAYDALKKQVEKSNAVGGAAVVLDAKTGEVLAMVNMPSYNPNDRAGITANAVRNRANIDIYEPGSIIKPILVSRALDEGIVKPGTQFDTHQYYVGTKLIKDDHAYPSMNVSEIIQHSSDIGTSKIALKLNKQDMWQYYQDMGFGHKVGTGFPGEATGILRNWKKWYPIDQAEMGFGYGVSVSLLQMARSYTVFT